MRDNKIRLSVMPLVMISLVIMIVFAGCSEATRTKAPIPVDSAVEAKDVPVLQNLVYRGLMEPDLKVNPYAGLALKPDGTPYRFAISMHWMDVDWLTVGERFLASLVGRAGGTTFTHSANWSLDNQVRFIDSVVALRLADGIFLDSVDENGTVLAAERAAAAGIAVVEWDTEIRSDKIVSQVDHKHNSAIGTEVVGNYFVQVAKLTRKHLYILAPWTSHAMSTIRNRHQGFHTAVDAYPDLITVIDPGPETVSSNETVMTIVMEAFATHPELNALFIDDGGGSGAVEGLKAMGRLLPENDPRHIYTAFNDCDSVTIAALDKGYLDAVGSHGPHDLADIAVKVMFNHLILGLPVPKRVISPMILITRDNISTSGGMIFGVPAAWPRLPSGMFDSWPVLNTNEGLLDANLQEIPGGIATPTVVERKQLQGY